MIGADGGIGAACLRALEGSGRFAPVGLSRRSSPALDLVDEASIVRCAQFVARLGQPRVIIVATGVLHSGRMQPEKRLGQLDPATLAEAFVVNTIGPALVMKHFLPLLARDGKAVFATLSARVGSIGDNYLGGWYSYRASKSALNQLVRTAAVELNRRQPAAICVALHPGTVNTRLSAPFGKTGLDVQSPELAAERLLGVIDRLGAGDSGGFFDQHGECVPW